MEEKPCLMPNHRVGFYISTAGCVILFWLLRPVLLYPEWPHSQDVQRLQSLNLKSWKFLLQNSNGKQNIFKCKTIFCGVWCRAFDILFRLRGKRSFACCHSFTAAECTNQFRFIFIRTGNGSIKLSTPFICIWCIPAAVVNCRAVEALGKTKLLIWLVSLLQPPMLFSWLMGIPQNEELKSVPRDNACVYVGMVSRKARFQLGHLIASMPTRPNRRVGCAPPVVRALHNMRGQDPMCIVALLLAFMCLPAFRKSTQRAPTQSSTTWSNWIWAELWNVGSAYWGQMCDMVGVWHHSTADWLFGCSWLWIISRRRNFQNFVILGIWTKSFWGSMWWS